MSRSQFCRRSLEYRKVYPHLSLVANSEPYDGSDLVSYVCQRDLPAPPPNFTRICHQLEWRVGRTPCVCLLLEQEVPDCTRAGNACFALIDQPVLPIDWPARLTSPGHKWCSSAWQTWQRTWLKHTADTTRTSRWPSFTF